MKIALLGGSFDPIHNGHITLGQTLLDGGHADEVMLIPCALSPHKLDSQPAPGDIRMEMIEAAIKGRSGFKTSNVELIRPTPSYTIDTLDTLSTSRPNDTLLLVLGADQLLEFESWKDYGRICREYELLLTSRDGVEPRTAGSIKLPRALYVEIPPVPISSTRIREKLAKQENVSNMLPAGVMGIIQRENLYGCR
jgi:nicotinate-nucleotide adenylyltransferase